MVNCVLEYCGWTGKSGELLNFLSCSDVILVFMNVDGIKLFLLKERCWTTSIF